MRRVLIIRFGSLGDLCLLAWSLSGQAARLAGPQRPHTTLAVKAAFASLAAMVPGVDAVVAVRGSDLRAVWTLARELRRLHFDQVLDAHDVLRSRALCAALGRRPARRITKDTVARLTLLRARRAGRGVPPGAPAPALNDLPSALRRSMLHRFDEVVAGVAASPVDPRAPHGAGPGATLLAATRGGALWPQGYPDASPSPRLGLAPGARWDTKRWPEMHWARLLQQWRGVSSAPVEIFVGAQERAWFANGPLARAAAALDGVTVALDLPLPELAGRLAQCSAVVTNDSGLLHLAEAAGTPVLALFGPTVRAFGYYPLLPGSRVLEAELACRPCSRNGRRRCWRGDLACLQGLEPAAALATLLAMPVWGGGPPPGRHDG